jgi:D-xylulose reductase
MIFAATSLYDGTLAKYYINAADFCYKVPDSTTLEEAAMVEPVLVLGWRPIGVLSQAVAKAWGAKAVIGVDVVESRLEVAKDFGADYTFCPQRMEASGDPIAHAEKVANLLKEKFSLGEGPDAVLECSDAEPCVQLGIYAARRGATFVQAGMVKKTSCSSLPPFV